MERHRDIGRSGVGCFSKHIDKDSFNVDADFSKASTEKKAETAKKARDKGTAAAPERKKARTITVDHLMKVQKPAVVPNAGGTAAKSG